MGVSLRLVECMLFPCVYSTSSYHKLPKSGNFDMIKMRSLLTRASTSKAFGQDGGSYKSHRRGLPRASHHRKYGLSLRFPMRVRGMTKCTGAAAELMVIGRWA